MKRAEEKPSAESILFDKIIKASKDSGNDVTIDDLKEIENDPAHLIVIDSMYDYANQVSAPLKKQIEKLNQEKKELIIMVKFYQNKYGKLKKNS